MKGWKKKRKKRRRGGGNELPWLGLQACAGQTMLSSLIHWNSLAKTSPKKRGRKRKKKKKKEGKLVGPTFGPLLSLFTR